MSRRSRTSRGSLTLSTRDNSNNDNGNRHQSPNSSGSLSNSRNNNDPNDKSQPNFGNDDDDNSKSFDSGFCPFCVNDNDARILYQGPWILTTNGAGALDTTTHQTSEPGSTVSLSFKGSGIVVFGTVPKSGNNALPPTVTYTVDTSEPFTTMQPFAADSIKNQPLFAVAQLSNDDHQIVINVLNASAPYELDYFYIFPQSNFTQTTVDSGPSTEPTPEPTPVATIVSGSTPQPLSGIQDSKEMVSATILKATTAVLGTLVIILLFLSVFLLFHLRRARQQNRYMASRYAPSYSKTNDNLGSRAVTMSSIFSETPHTIFTSSESIMHNYPSTLGGRSTYSRSLGGPPSMRSHSQVIVPLPAPPQSSPPPTSVQAGREKADHSTNISDLAAEKSHLSMSL